MGAEAPPAARRRGLSGAFARHWGLPAGVRSIPLARALGAIRVFFPAVFGCTGLRMRAVPRSRIPRSRERPHKPYPGAVAPRRGLLLPPDGLCLTSGGYGAGEQAQGKPGGAVPVPTRGLSDRVNELRRQESRGFVAVGLLERGEVRRRNKWFTGGGRESRSPVATGQPQGKVGYPCQQRLAGSRELRPKSPGGVSLP